MRLNGSFKLGIPPALPILRQSAATHPPDTLAGTRHPLGIYNASLSSVASAFRRVVNKLKPIQTSLPKVDATQVDDLLDSTRSLLYSLAEHVEDCERILYALAELKPANNPNRTKKAVREFRTNIGDYLKTSSGVANHVKHAQNRLRYMVVSNDKAAALGLFIEGFANDGSLGPNPEFHRGGSTGYSFNRFLRWHFCGIYWLSRNLSTFIYELRPELKPAEVNDPNLPSILIEIATEIGQLPTIFFPSEAQDPVPLIEVTGAPDRVLTVQCPANRKAVHALAGQLQISMSYAGDGTSRTFRLVNP